MTDVVQPRATRAHALCGIVAAVVAFLAFASTAMAARDPIAAGNTDLHMKHGFLRKASNLGLEVTALGKSATVDGNKIGLTVREGMLDPTDFEGHLENRDGFKLSRGKRGVPITQLSVNTAKRAVYAKVAKAKMQLGSLTVPVGEREGFGANFKSVKLHLTDKAARRISNRLGLRGSKRIDGGRVLSNSYSAAQPETVTVLQGSATLNADADTLAKLQAKGVEVPGGVTSIAPAVRSSTGVFTFPVSGGSVAPDLSAGTVATLGGIQILKEDEPFSPTMRLKELEMDFGFKAASAEVEILPTPPFGGKAGRSALVDIVLTGATISADPTSRTISVKDAEARLQAGTASTLNAVFNQPAPEPPPSSNFVLGDPLGKFSMVVQAP